MATDHNFRIKNGLTVGAVEVIDSSGKLTANAFGTNSNEKIEDVVADMITGSTHSNITVTYNDTNGTLAFSAAAQYGDSDVESYLDGGTSTPVFSTITSNGQITSSGKLVFSDKGDYIQFGSGGTDISWTAPVIFRESAHLALSDYSGVKLGGYNGTDYGPRVHVKGDGNLSILDGALQIGNTTVIGSDRDFITDDKLTFDYNDHYFQAGTNSVAFKNSGGTSYIVISNTGTSITGDITSTGDLTVTDFVKASGNNLKFSAGGTHVLNIDLNNHVYPQTHNVTDVGFSTSLAFKDAFFSGVGNFGTINTGQGATEVHLMNQNVRTTDSPTFAGLTTTGNIVAEDSEVRVGDTSGDNWTRIKHAQADGYGFDWQHDNATVIVNEQGSTNEVLVLGDVDAGNYSGLFGIAHTTDSGSNWTKKLDLKGNGELYIGASGTSHVYHEGHKPTYTELGTMAYSNLTGTPTIPSLSGYATESYVDTAVSNLVDSAPGSLDTLNELAAALGDDANFSTTVTNSIATKLPKSGGTMTGNLTISPSGSKIILDAYNTSQEGGGIFFREGFDSSNKYNLSIMARSRSNDGSADGLSINAYEGITFSTGSNSYNERLYLHSTAAFTVPITTTGTVTASGGNSGNWNTAYGWGNHASAGYLTSFDITTQTDSKYIRSDTSDNAAGPIVFGGGTATQYFRRNNTTNYTNAPLIVESYGGSSSTTGIGFHISGQLGRYLRMNSAGVLDWEGSTIWHAGNDGSGSGLDADTLDGQQLSAIARLDYDNSGEVRASNFKTLNGGNSYFYTSSGNLRGYIMASETVPHLRIATSGNESIGFYDGGPSGTENIRISGGGDLELYQGHVLLNNALELRSKDTGGNVRTITRINSSNQLEYGWSANGPVKFMGGGSYTERMRIDAAGFIQINSHTNSWAGGLRMISNDGTDTFQIHPDNNGYMYVDKNWYFTGDIHVGSIGQKVWHQGNDGASSGLDADLLDGQHGSYYLNYNNFTNTPTIPSTSGFATLSGSNSFTNSYNEFGNNTGAVSNDGSWAARVNISGSAHSRLDLFEGGDNHRLRLYVHQGHAAHIGTISDTDLVIETNGADRIQVHNGGDFEVKHNQYLTGSVDRRIKLGDSGTSGVSTSNNAVYVRGNDDHLILNCAGNGYISFTDNGTEHMRLTDGNLQLDGKIQADGSSGSNFYAIAFSRSGSGTTTPDIWGSNNTLVLGTTSSNSVMSLSSGVKIRGFSTSGGQNRDQAIYIGRELGDSDTEYFTMGWKPTARSGEQMQPVGGPYNNGKAFYIEAGSTEAGGICLDQDSVNVYGSSDGGTTFRVIDKDADVVTFEMLQTSWNGVFKGNVIAYGSMTSISDERIKENIKPIEPVINKIKNLGVYSYNKITAPEIHKDRKEIGVIAQEIQKEFPDLVNEESADPKETNGLDKILTVDYEHLTAVLLKGMQEQQEQIEELKSIINTLVESK